jgi:hypothetical protein
MCPGFKMAQIKIWQHKSVNGIINGEILRPTNMKQDQT